jgi:hypothetical protein
VTGGGDDTGGGDTGGDILGGGDTGGGDTGGVQAERGAAPLRVQLATLAPCVSAYTLRFLQDMAFNLTEGQTYSGGCPPTSPRVLSQVLGECGFPVFFLKCLASVGSSRRRPLPSSLSLLGNKHCTMQPRPSLPNTHTQPECWLCTPPA